MKLDLCCGSRKPEGFYGIDRYPFKGVDLVQDLNDGINLPDNSCEVVRAHDAIEHIKDGKKLIHEIWRVLIDGGHLDISVPSTDGRGAFQDLTHVSFWNENSFKYWINAADWMDYYRGPSLFLSSELYTTPMSEDKVCHVVFKAIAIKSKEWLNLYESRIRGTT